MVLFRIPDRLICVTLALKGSASVSMSSIAVSDLVGCTSDIFDCWLCGVDKVNGLILGGVWFSYRKSLFWLWDMGVVVFVVLVRVDVWMRGGGDFFWAVVLGGWFWDLILLLDKLRVNGGDVLVCFE